MQIGASVNLRLGGVEIDGLGFGSKVKAAVCGARPPLVRLTYIFRRIVTQGGYEQGVGNADTRHVEVVLLKNLPKASEVGRNSGVNCSYLVSVIWKS